MTPHRLGELDVFRGLAALTVAVSHLLLHFEAAYGFNSAPGWLRDISPAVMYYSGLLPVSFFFMISGFVIYMSIEKCPTWRDFAVSRASRLYPSYWTAILIFVLLMTVNVTDREFVEPSPVSWLANLLMVQGLVQLGNLDPVYWSLAYELKFYILLACIFFSPLRKYIDNFLLAWLAMSLAAAVAVRAGVTLPLILEYLNVTYSHFFVAGVVFYRRWKGDRSRALLCLLAATAAIPFIQWPMPVAMIAVSFWVIFWLVSNGSLGFIILRPLVFLGSISYALYLVHLPLGHTVEHLLNARNIPALVAMLVSLCLVIVVASLITFFIERPFMSWSRRAFKKYKTRSAAYSRSVPGLPDSALR